MAVLIDAIEFEITDPTLGAVNYLEHGYPSPLVRWHCHNEYELHYIVASSGKVFVGDYIGQFQPGNLILTGRRLPHNWISDTRPGERYELRDMLVQFEHATIEHMAAQIRELRELLPLLEEARGGIEFFGMQARADYYMWAIRDSSGPTRLGYFCQFLHELTRCPNYRTLSTTHMETNTDSPELDRVDRLLNYVTGHYQEELTLSRAAAQLRMSDGYFARFVKKSTGNTFNELLTRFRITKACELLSTSDRHITDICYEVGYNNVSNFNRRFLELKHVTPREYRGEIKQRLTQGQVLPSRPGRATWGAERR
jgi:AraC-like DNA-binding protein